MISIARSPQPPAIPVYVDAKFQSPDWDGKITRAARERRRAEAFFSDRQNYDGGVKLTDKRFSFNVYRDKGLAAELDAVFDGKCAYCESRFAHVSPKDVEHFRPKAEVDTKSRTAAPGYYWLAGDWPNLLVSCPDCNRARAHRVPGQPETLTLGKGNQFPLRDDRRRVRSHTGDVAREDGVRLLLNPCQDDPEVHLTYDERGLVHPRVGGAGGRSEMGRVSITVYALQRKHLVEERLRVINNLKFQLEQLRDRVEMQNEFIAEGKVERAANNSRQIDALAAQLAKMTGPSGVFLGMLREHIRRTKAAGGFAVLLAFGIDPEDLIR